MLQDWRLWSESFSKPDYLACIECFGKPYINIIFEEIGVALDALRERGRVCVRHCVVKESVKMNIVHALKVERWGRSQIELLRFLTWEISVIHAAFSCRVGVTRWIEICKRVCNWALHLILMRSCYLLSSFHIVHNQFEIKGSVLGLGEAPVALGAHVAQGATVTRARRFWKFFFFWK